MNLADNFAKDYRGARAAFLDACRDGGAPVRTFENPSQGPDGKPVYTDVAAFGDPSATATLIVNSATHGVEGFCGSGAMVSWLRTGDAMGLPTGVAVVLVHAINPHGFAWLRRVNEDNVDLNRNFIDHEQPRPTNAQYDALHQYVLPKDFGRATRAACDAALMAYGREHGIGALQSALSRGQYTHPDGVFYGGTHVTWSNRTFTEILAEHVTEAKRVAFIDFHTGLGPYAHGELISKEPVGSAEFQRLLAWYGPALKSSASGESASPELHGVIANAVRAAAPDAELSAITAEFGTYSIVQVLQALREDNWVHIRGDLESPEGRAAKAKIREAFYPDDPHWCELVGLRGIQLIRRAVAGLSA